MAIQCFSVVRAIGASVHHHVRHFAHHFVARHLHHAHHLVSHDIFTSHAAPAMVCVFVGVVGLGLGGLVSSGSTSGSPGPGTASGSANSPISFDPGAIGSPANAWSSFFPGGIGAGSNRPSSFVVSEIDRMPDGSIPSIPGAPGDPFDTPMPPFLPGDVDPGGIGNFPEPPNFDVAR